MRLFDEMFYLIDAFYFAMRFILIYLKLYLFKKALLIQSFLFHPPFQSFPITFIHFFQTLKFLPNPKNFKQTLSIACL